MMYDYIIIGSGIGALSAALNLITHKKRVLILEKNNYPGGLTTTFKRGRFEFDTTEVEIRNYANMGKTARILNKYGLSIDVISKPLNKQIIDLKHAQEYTLEGNFNDFCLKIEELEPNSLIAINNFKKVSDSIYHAYIRLLKNIPIKEDEYPLFYKYLDKNVYEALLDLKFSKLTINYFCYDWLKLASPINKLNFIDFVVYFKSIMNNNPVILKNKNLDLTLNMVNRYEKLGGKIYFNSKVEKIVYEKDYMKVTTQDNIDYLAKEIICDVSPRYVYSTLIKEENKSINRLENSRILSLNGLTIYLGLNKDYHDIGFKNYEYISYCDLNSLNGYNTLGEFNNLNMKAIIPNVLNNEASPKNTCEVILQTFYHNDLFNTTIGNYEKLKETLASNLISNFEHIFKIDIKEYIEQIEISTPKTVINYTNKDNGALFGYMPYALDNSINRIISYEDEKKEHITFVGSSSIFASSFDNTLYSGYYLTQKLLGKEVDIV